MEQQILIYTVVAKHRWLDTPQIEQDFDTLAAAMIYKRELAHEYKTKIFSHLEPITEFEQGHLSNN